VAADGSRRTREEHATHALESRYNLTITSISMAVAPIIGTIELVGVLADRLSIDSGPLAAIASINLDYVGYGIVGLFVLSWLTALAVWRFGRIEERWSHNLTG
jgi:high-affinity nickel-transport protein